MATTLEYNVKVNDSGAVKSLGQLEDELAGINEELREVPIGSKAFEELTKKSQALTKELDKVNQEVEGLKFEDKIMAADGAAKVFAGSLAAAVGTLGVLGVESERFGEFEQKAASAIAVGLGIKDVSEGFMQFGTVLKKSGIAAKLFGNITKTALIATGVGAFVVLIGTLVANWDKVTAAAKRFADSVPFIGKAINVIKDSFNSFVDAIRPALEFLGILPDEAERALRRAQTANEELIRTTQRELAIAEASGEAAAAIYELRKRLLEAEIQQLRDNAAEKEEIYAKETELLALNAAEQKRIRDEVGTGVEREKVRTVSAITSAGLAEMQVAKITTTGILTTNTLKQKSDQETTAAFIENLDKLALARQAGLDNLIAIAGAQTKVGRALLIAKQVLAAKELIMEAKKTITFSTLKASEATVATATGAAKTAAVGFPANIPLLIAYAAQAAGIIAAVVSAVKGAKSAAGGVGGDIPSVSLPSGRGAPSASAPSAPPTGVSPEVNAGCQMVRAYVVGGDVTSNQEAAARLNSKRTLG